MKATIWPKRCAPSQPNIQTDPPPGLVFPIAEIPHSNPTNANYRGNAVIGGVVYRGSRISQLYGAYVFSDNGSGKLWMLRFDGTNATPFQYLGTSAAGPRRSAWTRAMGTSSSRN